MTGVDPAILLQQLASGLQAKDPTTTTAANDGVFTVLLDRARSGQLSSGRSIELDPSVATQFSSDQLQRLAEAADRAEAAGAKAALVRIDGSLLRMDVENRRIDSEVDPQHGDVLTGIDAFIEATAPSGEPSSTGLLALPGGLSDNAALVRELAKLLAS